MRREKGRGKASRECAGGGDEGVRQGALRNAGVRGVGGREVRGLTGIVGWSIEKQADILIRGAGRLLHPSARSHLWRRGSPWRPGNVRTLLPLSVELRAPRRVGHRECGACGEGSGIGRRSARGRLLRGCEACGVIGERAVPASRGHAGRCCGMQRGICGSSEVVGRVLRARRPCQFPLRDRAILPSWREITEIGRLAQPPQNPLWSDLAFREEKPLRIPQRGGRTFRFR